MNVSCSVARKMVPLHGVCLRHDRVVFSAPAEICELVLDRGLKEQGISSGWLGE